MSNTQYKIEFDSINSGGAYSTGAAGELEDTLGEIATGFSGGGQYDLSAGYLFNDTIYLSMSDWQDIALSDLPGVTGGISEGTTSGYIGTNNPTGYTLSVRSAAATTPAMKCVGGGCTVGVDAIPDYSSLTYGWSLSNAVAFGFSPNGVDIHPNYIDDGSACGVGGNVGNCWDGLATTDKTIAKRDEWSPGVQTLVKFRTGLSGNAIQREGAYSATIVITAVTQ